MYTIVSGPPQGTPLLLLHGGGVAGWMWDPLRESLPPGHRVLVPDLPGHGLSATADYTSHEDAVARLAALLAREETPAAVVGFSLGAQLAALLAARHPELVDRVMVISAQAVPMRGTAATLALLDATAGLAKREWFARLQARALFVPDRLLDEYVRTSAGISRRTLRASVEENMRFTVPEGWRRFPGPAVVLAGARERAVMRRSAALLADAAPHGSVEIVARCGHGIPLQRPDWLAHRVDAWLEDRRGPAHP